MADFCIVKSAADKLKQAFKDGELSPEILSNPLTSSAERHAMFSEYMTPELAHEVNGAFEKALASNQKSSLVNWGKKYLDPKAPQTKGIIDKINELDGVIGEGSFYSDLIAAKVGVPLTPKELETVSALASKLESLAESRTATGSYSLEYWKAQQAVEDYVLSLNPSSALKLASGTYGRANLLGIPSAVTNILSNISPAASMAVTRRINARTIAGVNGDLVKTMIKEADEIYRAVGVDINRLDHINPRGELKMGEEIVHTEGTGAFRKFTKTYSDIIYKYMQGYPDFESANFAFHDNLNLNATRLARSTLGKGATAEAIKAKAAEFMIGAKRLGDLSEEGAKLRAVAIADARMSTWTEGGIVGDTVMKIRNVIDKATGNAMAGTFGLPFVKQPATALQRGIEASGPGIFKAFVKWPEAVRQAKLGNGVPMLNVTKSLVEAGLGLTTAAIITASIGVDDFIPDYALASPKEKALVAAKGATFNSIRFKGMNFYMSLDFMGLIGPALVGMLYAKKMANPLGYIAGVVGSASRVPGVSEVEDAIGKMMQSSQENADLVKSGISIGGSLISSILARSILQSGTLSNIDKGTDVQRQTGNDLVSKIVASLPFLRRMNPEKLNPVTGEVMTNESLVKLLLFGSRLKTATDNPVVLEINRLYQANHAPVISSVEYASTRFKDLKKQIGNDEFAKAMKFYGTQYSEQATELMSSIDYEESTDEEKKKMLDKIRSTTMEDTLIEFGYEKPEKE